MVNDDAGACVAAREPQELGLAPFRNARFRPDLKLPCGYSILGSTPLNRTVILRLLYPPRRSEQSKNEPRQMEHARSICTDLGLAIDVEGRYHENAQRTTPRHTP